MNQARIGQADSAIPVFLKDPSYCSSFPRQLEWHLENPRRDIFQDRFAGPPQLPHQIATLRDHCFARNQRLLQPRDDLRAYSMMLFTPVQQRHDDSGIEQYRFHFPKPSKCLLFEPKSETPDENCPSPITPRRFFRSWLASTSRKPSRTTREGLHPKSRTRDV